MIVANGVSRPPREISNATIHPSRCRETAVRWEQALIRAIHTHVQRDPANGRDHQSSVGRCAGAVAIWDAVKETKITGHHLRQQRNNTEQSGKVEDWSAAAPVVVAASSRLACHDSTCWRSVERGGGPERGR